MLKTVWDMTEKEVAAGTSSLVLTLAQLEAAYCIGVNMSCRGIRRHGIRQGTNPGRDPQGNPLFHPDGRPQMIDKMMSKSV